MKTIRYCVVGCCFLLSALGARAEDHDTESPYFVVLDQGEDEKSGQESLPLKSTDVDVNISGVIAEVTIRQVYHNSGDDVLEAIYVFPASTRAAVHAMSMKIGERTIVANVKERDEARAIYEQAKDKNQSASLLEQHRPNVFRMSVANIFPGDRVEVTLGYTEFLQPQSKVYEFVFPTVVGPRYANGSSRESNPWVSNPFLKKDVESPTEFALDVSLDTGMPLQKLNCQSHKAEITYQSESKAEISLSESEIRGANRDFILRYSLAGKEVSSGLLVHQGEDENFFLLMVEPPARVRTRNIPPREYLFVVDVSGSMNGFPLNTAKTLMRQLVSQLSTKDRFNVMLFAGQSSWYSPVSVPANRREVDSAVRWLEQVSGGGGTELLNALNRAFDLPSEREISRSLVVLTDGYVSFEREIFEVIEDRLDSANVFAFGIGASVNRYLIEGLSKKGRGEPFVVTEPSEAGKMAKRFTDYISAPVLTGVNVDFGSWEVYDVNPRKVADVMADRPITVFGKWRGKPGGEIELSGYSGADKISRRVSVEKTDSGTSPQQSALPYLWARERIAALSDFQSGHRGESVDAETRAEVVNLGLTYNLLTKYTSFVAVDDVVRKIPENAVKKKVVQPAPLPKGVPASAVGGGSTPEPGIIALILTGISAMFGRRWMAGRKEAN